MKKTPRQFQPFFHNDNLSFLASVIVSFPWLKYPSSNGMLRTAHNYSISGLTNVLIQHHFLAFIFNDPIYKIQNHPYIFFIMVYTSTIKELYICTPQHNRKLFYVVRFLGFFPHQVFRWTATLGRFL